MQPYLFPYIGYFQLIECCDKFIILDDVNYINRGWINRNRILTNGAPYTFTLPILDASQNKLINQLHILQTESKNIRLLKTLKESYSKAKYFSPGFELCQSIINHPITNLSSFNHNCIIKVCRYLEIKTPIIETSARYNNSNLKGQDRILNICQIENANEYVNPIGGINLYDTNIFQENNIKLHFLESITTPYQQIKNHNFTPNLSIIDAIMNLSIKDLRQILLKFNLI